MRLVSWAGAVLIAISAALPALAQEPDPARAATWMDNLMWGRGHVGGPFELIDQNGNRRTDADLRGRLLIVYFGYSVRPSSAAIFLRPALHRWRVRESNQI